MRKVRTNRRSDIVREQKASVCRPGGESAGLAYAADHLIRQFGGSKAGRTYALRLIGVYAVFSELGFSAFHEYGYTRDQAAYFIKRLQSAGLFTQTRTERLQRKDA